MTDYKYDTTKQSSHAPHYSSGYEKNPLLDGDSRSDVMERGTVRHPNYDRSTHKCYHNPDDWHEDCHEYYNCRSTWSLILSVVALLTTLWPLSIISLCLISRVKRTVHCGHRHSCKVFSAFWLSWIGVILGILEWIAIVLTVFETQRTH